MFLIQKSENWEKKIPNVNWLVTKISTKIAEVERKIRMLAD